MLISILIVLIVILVSMTLHELMHGFVAYKLGDDTAKDLGRLTLNPLKHLDPWMSVVFPLLMLLTGGPIFGAAKPVPINTRMLRYNEWGFALVALAGPLTNFVLAFIGYIFWYLSANVVGAPDLVLLFWNYWVVVNLGFFAFNLLPIPPLDGSRLLYAIAPDAVRRLMEKMESFGLIFIIILIFLAGALLSTVIGHVVGWSLWLFQSIIG
ncbi:site-2 protease family protein [Candidatus Saccharibacteria bacterium]|nr:site-2 protease family protein [Candidatus Saccharibacteria bacterium]